MSFDNTKFHCEINTVPYMLDGYQKSELAPLIPRLSSGDQSESDFDLLKSKTIKGFKGGQLQRFWEDDTSVLGAESMFPIYGDGVLYPVKNMATSATGLIGKGTFMCSVQNKDYVYIAYAKYSDAKPYIIRRDVNGTEVTLTLPAAVSVAGCVVYDMVIHQNRLWLSITYNGLGTTGDIHFMELNSTTVNKINGGNIFYKMVSYKDGLYGTGAGGDVDQHSSLYRYTGDLVNSATVLVGRCSGYSGSAGSILVYNNRIMITRFDGLFVYDGIQLGSIEDSSNQPDLANYKFPVVLKGYMYYFMPDGWYRFNGSLIEKLYDTNDIGVPVDVCVGKNRIWLSYANSADTPSTRYDKSMGYNYTNTNDIEGRVAVFDGVAMYTYGRTTVFTKNPASIDASHQAEPTNIIWFADKLYVFRFIDKSSLHDEVSTAEVANTGTASWRIVTSIFDDDFPMIDKDHENFEVVLDGNVASDETITIEYRTSGFDGSTGWTTIGTIKTQSRVKEYLFRTQALGITYKKAEFRFSGTTTLGYGISKIVLRYMLSPDVKWQWRFTALCYGDDIYAPLLTSDNLQGTQLVSLLRGNLYDARAQDVPIKFIDIDQLDLSGVHNNSVTTITLNSTNMLKEYGFVQIDDEVIYYAAKTSTTLTGCVRAMMGTAAASHADNAKVFPTYRAIIRTIVNERVILNDTNNIDTVEDKSRNSEITLLLQEV